MQLSWQMSAAPGPCEACEDEGPPSLRGRGRGGGRGRGRGPEPPPTLAESGGGDGLEPGPDSLHLSGPAGLVVIDGETFEITPIKEEDEYLPGECSDC